jgi:hypothetical protein
MKNGKIVLSAAAFIATAAGVFAFKGHSKIAGHKLLYGKTSLNKTRCTLSTCNTFGGISGKKGICHTVFETGRLVVQGPNHTLWTSQTFNGHCQHPTTKWTNTY